MISSWREGGGGGIRGHLHAGLALALQSVVGALVAIELRCMFGFLALGALLLLQGEVLKNTHAAALAVLALPFQQVCRVAVAEERIRAEHLLTLAARLLQHPRLYQFRLAWVLTLALPPHQAAEFP